MKAFFQGRLQIELNFWKMKQGNLEQKGALK